MVLWVMCCQKQRQIQAMRMRVIQGGPVSMQKVAD
jgi:hypothetical protein